MDNNKPNPFEKSDCPDIPTLAKFSQGKLDGEEHSKIVRHLAFCDDCLEMVGKAFLFTEEIKGGSADSSEITPKSPEAKSKGPIPFLRKFEKNYPQIFQAAASVIFLAVGMFFFQYTMNWPENEIIGRRGEITEKRIGGKPVPEAYESHALVIGQSYLNNENWENLPGVSADIPDISAALNEAGFQVQLMMEPKRKEMEDGIKRFIEERGKNANNRLLIYFAGHGYSLRVENKGTPKGYLVASDTASADNAREFIQTAFGMERIGLLAQMNEKVAQMLFVFDACFSGTVFYNANGERGPTAAQSANFPVRQFITAGSAYETVPDQSIFKEYFIKGIRGAADYPVNGKLDGNISAAELGFYLWKELKDIEIKGFRQTPQFGTLEKIWGATEYIVKYASSNPVKGEETVFTENAEWEEWFRISREENHESIAAYLSKYPKGRFYASAYRKLADLYAEKRIPKEFYQRLIPALKKGVEKNDPHAMYVLGAMYYRNEIKIDETEARDLLAKAEKGGAPHAMVLAGEEKLKEAAIKLKEASILGFDVGIANDLLVQAEEKSEELKGMLQENEEKLGGLEKELSALREKIDKVETEPENYVVQKIDQSPDVLKAVNRKLFNEFATLMLAVTHQSDLAQSQKYVLVFSGENGEVTEADFYPETGNREELLYAIVSVPKGNYTLTSVKNSFGDEVRLESGIDFSVPLSRGKTPINLAVMGKGSLVIKNNAKEFSAFSNPDP